jgi:hypothetical protein
MYLSEINIYPVKSFRGFAAESGSVERAGLAGDRRWMVVDTNGRFLSQREHPVMATFSAELRGGELVLGRAGESISVPAVPGGTVVRSVEVWNDALSADVFSGEVNEWLSAAIGLECALVRLPESGFRPVDPDFATAPDDRVSFADAFPYLLVGQASLDELNRRLAEPVPMDRFRPNLVVSGTGAFEEDGWRRIRIGSVEFRIVKPCARCVLTTVDQEKGVRTGAEPLRTLAAFRTSLLNGKPKVLFGQNLIAAGFGNVRVGDRVEVLD